MLIKSLYVPGHSILRAFSKKRAPFIEKSRIGIKSVKVAPRYPVLKARMTMDKKHQEFDNLLVLDFEATCQENSLGPITPVQEIIEFPVVQISTKDWKEIRRFHEYVRPTINPRLTSFCTNLTGIIQEMVDNKPTIDDVLKKFDKWITEDPNLGKFAFVTCGDWDLKVALPNEADFKKIKAPCYFNQWINLKKAYASHTGNFVRGMPELLRIYNLKMVGRHHSGIDDVANICEIARCLGESGHVYRITSGDVQRRRVFNDVKGLV
ncbi:unnamed protein product [Caenorhabditis bovis]|uniref:Exonuclease domain-containing protein n=1 Tax=Caenorhabditis bovis TaxID=2654633 RepID=A0A8S1F0X6_9PELO|nr:unnamed protein product [Caenorhabditis bovis]